MDERACVYNELIHSLDPTRCPSELLYSAVQLISQYGVQLIELLSFWTNHP